MRQTVNERKLLADTIESVDSTLNMHSSIDSRQRAIALVEQLSAEKLPAVVQLLELLTSPPDQSPQSPGSHEESRLLEKIGQAFSAEKQSRLNDLRQRCEWEQLTDTEHKELISYEDQQEQLRVDRLSALIELAKSRNIDLLTLNQELLSSSEAEIRGDNVA